MLQGYVVMPEESWFIFQQRQETVSPPTLFPLNLLDRAFPSEMRHLVVKLTTELHTVRIYEHVELYLHSSVFLRSFMLYEAWKC